MTASPYVSSTAMLGAGYAHDALKLARRRKLALPKPLVAAEEVLAAVDAAHNTPKPPAPELPTKAADVAAAIATVATERARVEQVRALAAELRGSATARIVAAAREAAPGWIDALAEEFSTVVEQVRKANAAAPDVAASDLASLSPEQFTAWQSVQAQTRVLEALLQDRQQLAILLGEQARTRNYGSTLPLVAVAAPVTGDIRGLREAFEGRVSYYEAGKEADPVTRWRRLLDAERYGYLSLSLARHGQVQARVDLFEAWREVPFAITANDGGATVARLQAQTGEHHQALTAA